MKKTNELQIPEVVLEVRKNRAKQLRRKMKEYWPIYVMIIPVVVFYIIFSYYPMYGLIISLKKYSPRLGIIGSQWMKPLFRHFELAFNTPYFWRSMKNTVVLSLLKIIFMFPMPIIMALLLNEVKRPGYKKGIQTIIYLPNFITWVIYGSIVQDVFGFDGYINNIRALFGWERKSYMANSSLYYPILIFFSNLKNTGWNTIIYMAAISAVSPTLYEAGTIDGCGRFRLMWNVTLPCIGPVVILQFLLAVGNIMNAGFDEVFNTYNVTIYDRADIMDTYIHRLTFEDNLPSQSVATGLFKSIINFILLMTANLVVKKVNGTGIYDLND